MFDQDWATNSQHEVERMKKTYVPQLLCSCAHGLHPKTNGIGRAEISLIKPWPTLVMPESIGIEKSYSDLTIVPNSFKDSYYD